MSESFLITVPFIISVLGFASVVIYNALRGVRTTREALGTYLAVVLCSFVIGLLIVIAAHFMLG